MLRKPARHGRLRDALIVAGVLALAGVALADAVRGGGGDPEPRASTEPGTSTIAEDPFRALPGVPAPGSIVLLDNDGCAVRQIVVSSGQELPLPRIETGCELWAAPRGGLVAYALDGPYGEFKPFRLVDLSHPDEPLGTFQTFSGVTWSLDGQRASWCHDAGRGFDFAVRSDEEPRILGRCPVGYTSVGRPAFVSGFDRLVAGGETVLRAPTEIAGAVWGRDGSVALFLGSGELARAVGGEILATTDSPPTTAAPALSPDGCGVAYPVGGAKIELRDLCGGATASGTLDGTAVSWSPDGEWLAVADGDEIVFHHLTGTLGMTRWEAGARALAWVR